MYMSFKRLKRHLQSLSLPFFPFVPSVAETLIRVPSTSPFTAGANESWSPTNVLTWLIIFMTGVTLQLHGKLRKMRSPGSVG